MTAGVSSSVHPPNPADLTVASGEAGAGPCPGICPWGAHGGSHGCWGGPGQAGTLPPAPAVSRSCPSCGCPGLGAQGSQQDPAGISTAEQHGAVQRAPPWHGYLVCHATCQLIARHLWWSLVPMGHPAEAGRGSSVGPGPQGRAQAPGSSTGVPSYSGQGAAGWPGHASHAPQPLVPLLSVLSDPDTALYAFLCE